MDGKGSGLNMTERKMRTWLGNGIILPVNGMEMPMIKSLQAFNKVSQEHLTTCLRAGSLMTMLSYFGFFSTRFQRLALSTVASICNKLLSDVANFVMEAACLIRIIREVIKGRMGMCKKCLFEKAIYTAKARNVKELRLKLVTNSKRANEANDAGTKDYLVGRKLGTRWPEDQNFYEVVILDYNPLQRRPAGAVKNSQDLEHEGGDTRIARRHEIQG
nr:E3 ubiquitin-protein ligase UPL3-like [Tanacetum cinerariifolium]